MNRVLDFAAASFLAAFSLAAPAQSVQQHVHSHGGDVMPFEVASTVHVFRMTVSGGVQQVVLRDGDRRDQLPLIQQHLQAEAARFGHGDYSDPARLHGSSMPGLAELQQGAGRIEVSYQPLPNGAQLTFKTADPGLVTAIHRWFGAQLSEHGGDARAE